MSNILSTLCGAFFGALFAFLFNYWLRQEEKINIKKSLIAQLIVIVSTILTRAICIKIATTKIRLKLLNENAREDIITNITTDKYLELRKFFHGRILLNFPLQEARFLSDINPRIYQLLLSLNDKLNDYSSDLDNLNYFNKECMNSDKKRDNNNHLDLVVTYNILFVKSIDDIIFYCYLLIKSLYTEGTRHFEKLSIKEPKLDTKYRDELTNKNHIKGYEDLTKKFWTID